MPRGALSGGKWGRIGTGVALRLRQKDRRL